MKNLRCSFLCFLLIGSAGFANVPRHLDCEPPGYDGTPSVMAVVQYDSVLQNVTSQYIFEQGEMEPSRIGTLTALPQNESYSTQAFVLINGPKAGSTSGIKLYELLILPRYLTSMASGVNFNGLFENRSTIGGKESMEHRTLRCTIK